MPDFNIEGYNCSVDLTLSEFWKLESLDYLEVVCPALEKLGAIKIEYNGHFGPNVFYTAGSEAQCQAIAEEIKKLIGDENA